MVAILSRGDKLILVQAYTSTHSGNMLFTKHVLKHIW